MWQHYHVTHVTHGTGYTPPTVDQLTIKPLKPISAVSEQPITELASYTPAQPKAVPTGCTDAKSCIYMHESGNSPTAVNSIGCRGLGQACPGDKLPCGDDYACQDAYFTQYALSRYGSWDAAWVFWQANRWW